MISSLGYRILGELDRYGMFFRTRAMANLVGETPAKTNAAFRRLLRAGFVRTTIKGYQITEEGSEEIEHARDHPLLTQDAKSWIGRVRAGIDSDGHQTKIDRAAIPNRLSPELSYTMPMEEMIDEMRKGLAEYD